MNVTQYILISSCLVFLGKCAMEPFVVGGKNASIADFPYATYLGVECIVEDTELVASWFCGASIISQFIMLTAGHCLFRCSEDSLLVLYMGHETIPKEGIATAHSFLIHEYYSHMWLANDIGLVKLNSPLMFNRSISRVALMEHPPYKEEAKMSGWGIVRENPMKPAPALQFIEQYVWEKQDCLDLLKRMPEGTFCARGKNNSGFASVGDSGNALVVRGYIQIGLVSFKTTKHSTSVTVYTDTGFFFNWIEENSNKIMCSTS